MGIYLSKDGISYLWSKIKNKFYIKPSTGIPKSDLASSVQTSLGKADTALQKHQDISGKVDNTAAGANSLLSKITNSWTATPTDNTYFIRQDTSSKNEFGRVKFSTLWSYIKSKVESLGYTKNTGTITGIKMNGASKGTSGVVDLGTVITAHQDISGKQDKSTAVTHSANTAVGSATKPVYVAANGIATPISHSINSDVPANAKFTDTTYNDATQSTHGLMTAADKKKLDGMDLSKYLPKSGGVMTGDIDMQTNKRDILLGTHKATTSDGTAVAGGTINTDKKFVDLLPTMRSYMGTYNYKTASIDQWYDLISVRHRNGYGDGSGWGMIIYANLFGGNLQWNLNTNKDVWQGGRVLLDSANYTNYAAKSNHTHDSIVNNSKLIAGSNNAAQWCRLGTLTSSENFSTAVISVWSGDGANGNASQNSWFEIHIKDEWQSSQSATKACGVTVYRTRCGTVKVKVIPTAHNTFTVWVYLPWGYWNGNYAVNGRYKAWTTNFTHQTAEPEGTAADTAYYDHAFLTSTVANATTWNGLINDVDTYNSSDTLILVKKDNRIQHRYAGELDVNSAKTLVDSGWSSVTTYVVDKSKFNNISTEFRRIGQIAWVKCSFTPNVAMTNITICDVVNVDPFVAVTPANTVFGVGSASDGSESFIASISYNPDRKLRLSGNFKPSTIYRLMFSYPVT